MVASEVSHVPAPVSPQGAEGAVPKAQGLGRQIAEAAAPSHLHALQQEQALKAHKPVEARDDLLPVILGGEIGVYALGREFHEAFGVRSVCIVPLPIKAVAASKIFDVRAEDPTAENVKRIVCELADKNPHKKIVVVANTDAYVKVLEACVDDFPEGVYCPLPPRDVVERVSNKATFAELCDAYGLDTPRTTVVHLAGDDPIPASDIPFPVVAKPAESASFFHLHYQGFHKAYCIQDQAALDSLWKKLRDAGYEGDFLVQELIEGDDTLMDCITVYVDRTGRPTMFAGMQILLQDHAPTMIGNYVAMLTRPQAELWEKVGAMLSAEGYRGFANFDVKCDPKTGRVLFLDFNPRVGRASYSVCAAGVNPMRVLVSDVVDGKDAPVLTAQEPALYALVPKKLLLHYVRDPHLRREVEDLYKSKRAFDPQNYWPERDPRRALFVQITRQNHRRKFATYYPEASDDTF